MIYTEQAIKKAIEGGWTPNMFSGADWTVKMVRAKQDDSKTLLDSFFWQCLGKRMGWVNGDVQIMKTVDHGTGSNPRYTAETHTERRESPVFYWHSLIDHLASGGDAEGYFKELLS